VGDLPHLLQDLPLLAGHAGHQAVMHGLRQLGDRGVGGRLRRCGRRRAGEPEPRATPPAGHLGDALVAQGGQILMGDRLGPADGQPGLLRGSPARFAEQPDQDWRDPQGHSLDRRE
jgi:hypothetical protein